MTLLYIRDRQQLDDYREYFRRFSSPKPITIAHSFEKQEDADVWLASGSAKESELVRSAGQGFVVLNALKGLKFVPLSLPE